MLRIHRSNRVELLVEQLAATLSAAPLSDPMATELVVVHSRGMERWLTQRLSQRLGSLPGHDGGVCANVSYPFPAGLVHTVLAACLADDPNAADRWAPERLTWSILAVLPELLDKRCFAPLQSYLRPGPGTMRAAETGTTAVDRRAYGLARRIADVFDRYSLYRPTMALAWSKGEQRPERALAEAQAWQPELWKALQDRIGAPTLAERFARARRVLAQAQALRGSRERDGQQLGLFEAEPPGPARDEPAPTEPSPGLQGLPERVSLFGLSALAPAYLDVLRALAGTVNVELFLLCPSDRAWLDLRSRARQDPAAAGNVTERTTENPILLSLGRLGRDFQQVLELADHDAGSHDAYVDSALFHDPLDQAHAQSRPPTMLEVLQSDLLHNRRRRAQGADTGTGTAEPRLAQPDDDSIQIHACHGATRQVEVLRDALLRLLDADPTLEPRDILVMMPDVEQFAPLISAVFSDGTAERSGRDGWGPAGAPQLPFFIADRSLRQVNPVASALMKLLDLVPSRLEASQVLDLLGSEPVLRRFGLGADDLPRITGWVRESGIRWAIDADHRAHHGQPRDVSHTWRFGLDRLLLGAAMADEDERLFRGVAPFDDMEGDAVELLGRFVSFCEVLFDQVHALREPRPLVEWQHGLLEALAALTATTEQTTWLALQVREVLARMVDEAHGTTAAGSERSLTIDAVRGLLEGSFSIGSGAVGHQTGAVTFCAMVPMRSIPHRVVCLLGMDDGAFPRGAGGQAFDLIAADPRVGDRSPRDEDRLLLLEALLAARTQLIICYTGRDIRTGERRPPAVPVGELLDSLDESFVATGGHARVRDQITLEHPLQAFSPRNFGVDGPQGTEPLCHDTRLCAGAQHLLSGRIALPPFLAPDQRLPEPLGAQPAREQPVLLSDLSRFFENPTRYLLNQRLGVFLGEEQTGVEDREPFELSGLEQWSVGNELLCAALGGRDEAASHAALAARGQLPAGTPGSCLLDDIDATVHAVLERARQHLSDEPEEVPIDLELGEVRLLGSVSRVVADLQLTVQYGAIQPRHELALWLRHLALVLARPHRPTRSVIVGKAKQGSSQDQTLGPLGDDPAARLAAARQHLTELIELFLRGQHGLLPLFEHASRTYAAAIFREPNEPDAALAAAAQSWRAGYDQRPGDGDDPHVVHVYGADSTLAELAAHTDFAAIACRVWLPLLRAQPPRRSRGRS